MAALSKAIKNYYGLIIIFFIFLIMLIIVALIMKKKDTKTSRLLYGLFMDYNNMQIIALTLILMNFILLVFYLVMGRSVSIAMIIISMLFIIISYILNFNLKYLIINPILNGINLGILYFASLVNTLKMEVNTKAAIFLQVLIIVFGFLFYLFATIKFIFNIRGKDELDEEDN